MKFSTTGQERGPFNMYSNTWAGLAVLLLIICIRLDFISAMTNVKMITTCFVFFIYLFPVVTSQLGKYAFLIKGLNTQYVVTSQLGGYVFLIQRSNTQLVVTSKIGVYIVLICKLNIQRFLVSYLVKPF